MLAKRIALLLAALLLALASHAATVEQRSPFPQGHRWDPTLSGHGFELLSVGRNVMAVWYTYDASERPVWYTAQGPVHGMGGRWPWCKHRWGGERIAESTHVGPY